MSFSTPYLDHTLAFVVTDAARHDWATREGIRAMESPGIAVPRAGRFRRLLEELVPDARLVEITAPRPFFRGQMEDVDALAFGAEAGGAWTLVYPGYAVAVPKPEPIRIPLAYAVRRGEWEWSACVSAWIELEKRDLSMEKLYDHWILGEASRPPTPR